MLRAVLFDLDGTLIDSLPGIIESFKFVVAKHFDQRQVNVRQVLEAIGRPLEQLMLEVGGDHTKIEIMVQDYRDHNKALINAMPLFPHCFEVVSELKRAGIKVGLVTSKNRHSTFMSLDLHGLTGLLDVVITKDDTEKHKPDPEPLIVAMGLLDVKQSETAYVGDSIYDIQCAQAAGCLDIAALWGAFDRAVLLGAGPTHSIELPQRLLEMNFGLAKINCKLP